MARANRAALALTASLTLALTVAASSASLAPPATAQTPPPPAAWLDTLPEPWAVSGATVPAASAVVGFSEGCDLQQRPAAGAEEAQLAAAGWRLAADWATLRQSGVAVVMATAGYDGMCRPLGFNAFVFQEGRYAGTLSPVFMSSRLDGALPGPAAIRLLDAERIDASFLRYAPDDPVCCPSGPRTVVAYRIVAGAAGPVVVPERGAGGAGVRQLPSTGGPGSPSPSVAGGVVAALAAGLWLRWVRWLR